MTTIHTTAIVDPKAELDPSVEVGPYAIIEAGVRIGPRTKIGPHVHIQGVTDIGADNTIGTGATLGLPPQHLAYDGRPTRLTIGDHNIIREYANIHRAFEEDAATVVGDHNFIMGYSHIGHDCHIENHVIIANGALIAGHVSVGSRTFISGPLGIHQFCRIGRLAMVGGLARINQDVPPFMVVEGHPAHVRAMNAIGLRRAGFTGEQRQGIKGVFRRLYRGDQSTKEAVTALGSERESLSAEARELVEFYEDSKRGVTPYTAYSRQGVS